MSSSNSDLERLKSDTGIDFAALRDKYKNMTEGDVRPVVDNSERERNRDAMSKLDNYAVCKTCNGQGIVTEVYNHFKMEKNCPDCDGEGIFERHLASIESTLTSEHT